MFKYFKKHVSRYAEEVAEVLAPTLRTPQEEFKHNWTTVSELLTNKATGVADADESRDDDDDAHESSKVFQLLDRMLEMLLTEEEEQEGMGPCMEFMLQSGVLKHLVHCGQFTWPDGIMGKVLLFFAGLLDQIKQTPMIPDKHVYGPLKNLMLVHVADPRVCSKNEGPAVEFLMALCVKLGQFPGYADFFVQAKQTSPDTFLPAAMLQPLLLSADEHIAVKARECLRVLLQMQSPSVDTIVIEGGMESAFIVQHFVRLYAALPPNFDSEEIHAHVLEWIESRYDGWKRFTTDKHPHVPEDSRAFLEFMDWVHFYDDVLETCSEKVAAHLVGDIISRFFVTQIVPMLTQQSEEVAYATTGYLTACITQISSPAFLRGVAGFLLGPPVGTSGLTEDGASASREASERMHTLLVQRCDDISDELSAATLLLFLRLLLKRDPVVLDALVLRYAKTSVAPPTAQLRVAMHVMADKFTSELPENLRTDDVDVSYKEYFVDAQRAVLEARRAAALFGSSASGTNTHRHGDSAGATGDDADEGPSFDDGECDDDANVGIQGSDTGGSSASAGGAPSTESSEATAARGESGVVMSEGGTSTEEASTAIVSCPCDSPFVQVLSRRLRQLPNQPYSLNLLVTANYAALLE